MGGDVLGGASNNSLSSNNYSGFGTGRNSRNSNNNGSSDSNFGGAGFGSNNSNSNYSFGGNNRNSNSSSANAGSSNTTSRYARLARYGPGKSTSPLPGSTSSFGGGFGNGGDNYGQAPSSGGQRGGYKPGGYVPTTRAQRSGGRRKFASAGAGVLGGTNSNSVAQSGGYQPKYMSGATG